MKHRERKASVTETIITILVVMSAAIMETAFIGHDNWYWGLLITLPLLIAVVIISRSKKTMARH